MFITDSKKIKKFLASSLPEPPKTKEVRKDKTENKSEKSPSTKASANKKMALSKAMSLKLMKQKMADPCHYFMNNWDFGKFRSKNQKLYKSLNFSLAHKLFDNKEYSVTLQMASNLE